MSHPHYKWLSYVRAVVKAYPRYKKQVHNADEQAEYEAVRDAIIETERTKDNYNARMTLINLVFWKQTRTLQGAAMQVGYSYSQARRIQRDFLHLVAKNLGVYGRMSFQSQKTVL